MCFLLAEIGILYLWCQKEFLSPTCLPWWPRFWTASLLFKAEELRPQHLLLWLLNYLDKNPNKIIGDINGHSKLFHYLKALEKRKYFSFILETMRNILIPEIQKQKYELHGKVTRIKYQEGTWTSLSSSLALVWIIMCYIWTRACAWECSM